MYASTRQYLAILALAEANKYANQNNNVKAHIPKERHKKNK